MRKTVLMGFAVLMAGLLTAPASAQQYFNYGQFMTGRFPTNHYGAGGYVHVGNPTDLEMYAVAIIYRGTGELETNYRDGGCEGAVIPAHGNDFSHLRNEEENDLGEPGVPVHYEVIAVPSSATDRAGEVSPELGVLSQKSRFEQGRAVDPGAFHLDAQANLCVCCALAEDEQNMDLFSGFGIECADYDPAQCPEKAPRTVPDVH